MPAPDALLAPFVALTRDGEVCVAHPAPTGPDEEHAFALHTPAAARAQADMVEVLAKHVATLKAAGVVPIYRRAEGWGRWGVKASAPATGLNAGRIIELPGSYAVPGSYPTTRAQHLWKIEGVDRCFATAEPPPDDDRVTRVGGIAEAPVAKVAKVYTTRILKDGPGADQQLVTGIVLEPETVDSQGDIYSAEEIARAAHGFMADYQNVGLMHRTLVNSSGRIVESYIAPCDFELGGQAVKSGTWLMTMHVTNEALWRQIKDGSLTGYSIGGFAQRVAAQ